MSSLYILIPIAVIFVALALWVFLWFVRSGQFDDLDSPAYRILFDDKQPNSAQEVDESSSSSSSNASYNKK